MFTGKIIVISDTHDICMDYILQHIRDLHPATILLNGDITSQATLNAYSSLCPELFPVRGDKDTLPLPRRNVQSFNGMRIGQTHGDRPAYREKPSIFINRILAGHGYFWNAFAFDALSQFPMPLDFLVTGHLHVPFIRKIGETTVVNPGAIAVNSKSHHLLVPTIAVLEPCSIGFEPVILALKKGRKPYHLIVDGSGPIQAFYPAHPVDKMLKQGAF